MKIVDNNLTQAKLDPSLTVEVRNDELIELLKTYAQENNAENLNKMIGHLTRCRVLMPSMLTENKQPSPCLIKNNEGVSYLPVYTDRGQIPEHVKADGILNLPYLSANRTAFDQKDKIAGIVVNPFSQNLILQMTMVERIEEVEKAKAARSQGKVKKIRLTDEQYVQFERRQFEVNFLPRKLYSEGQVFVDALVQEKEAYIDRLYEESYKEKRRYPYLEEDFSVMILNITQDLMVVRVDMPNRDMAPGLVYRVYVTWNPETRRAGYYRFAMGKKKSDIFLEEVSPDMRLIGHGAAPEEGMELQTIIDLAKGTGE